MPRWSVRDLLLWLVLACLLPGMLGSAVLFVYQYQVGRAELEKDMLQTTRALRQAVDGELAKVRAVAQVLASSHDLATRDYAGFYRRATAVLQETNTGSNVVLIDPSGQQMVNTLRPYGEPLRRTQLLAPMQRLFATGEPFVSEVFTSRSTGAPTIAIYVPVRAGGKTIYALGIGLLQPRLNQILVDQRLPTQWVTAILDSAGTIAARTYAPERFVGQRATPYIVQRILAAPEGAFESVTLEGMPTYTFYNRSPVTNWSVVVGIPRRNLEAPLLRSAVYFGLGIAVLFGIGVGLAWTMGGRIARSVKALGAPASALEAGGSVVLPKVHFREAAEVALSMANAALVLKLRSARLTHAKQALELSDARLRGIFDSATDAILTADETRAIVMANPAAAKMFGRSIDELVGMQFEQLMPERFRAQHPLDVRDFGNGDVGARHMGRSRDVMGLRADSQEFPIDAAISHLHLGDQRLYTVILRDITERRRAETALQESEAALRRLLAAQDSVQEVERKRIARELHDDLQQTLSAIKLNLAAAVDRLVPPQPDVPFLLAEADRLASAAIVSTRRIVNDLRPHMLEDLGLADALNVMAGQFSQRTGIDCDLQTQDDMHEALARSPDVASCLYRVVQESLNNVFKHAQASTVEIGLSRLPDGRAMLRVTDNGKGMTADDRNNAHSFGLMGMRERLRAIGGELRITSAPGSGTTIEALVPLQDRA